MEFNSVTKPVSYLLKILALCQFVMACSNSEQSRMQDYFISEFISTYGYVATQNQEDGDTERNFKLMRNMNSDALSTIAYKWHKIARENCEPTNFTQNSTKRSSYEIMLDKNKVNDLALKTTESDRECLAKIYQSHWQQINNMITFHFPNINQVSD